MKQYLALAVSLLTASLMAGDPVRQDHIAQQQQQLKQQIEAQGGLAQISEKNKPINAGIMKELSNKEGNRPKVNGQAFSRGITLGSIAEKWSPRAGEEENEGTPIAVIVNFDRQLKALGINLVVVPVPGKVEAYPDLFVPGSRDALISPARTDAMLKLLALDVEVLDILPALKATRDAQDLNVYEVSGHHPSGFGAKTAGEEVAKRLAHLQLEGRDLNRFKAVERKATERVDRSVPMQAWQVQFADGSPYESVGDGQVVVMGDSHALAFRDASWASHIARATGVPITDISSSGGANEAHLRLANMGVSGLKGRKAVVWIMTGVGLSQGPWPKAEIPQETTLAGLITMGDTDGALALFEKWKDTDPKRVYLDENMLNNMGYGFANGHKKDKAEAVFKLNILIHPESANAYDSLGEFYARNRKRDLALANFQKSLSLNPPKNVRDNTMRWLTRLGLKPDGSERSYISLSAEALDRLVGYYELSESTTLSIYREESKLFAVVMGRTMELNAATELEFHSDEGLKLEFRKEGEDLFVEGSLGANSRSGKRVSDTPKRG